jgi:uncharacterized protein
MIASMPDAIVSITAIVTALIVVGAALGAAGGGVRWRWLLVAAALVLLNDLLLTRGYGALLRWPEGAERNWIGKLLALAATLAIAALPAFGWRRSGLTLAQAPGSLRPALPVAAAYALFFLGVALAFDSGPSTRENTLFQLTMPGLEEEPFYRGILLLALDRALPGRVRALGVEWGWGALLSCALFGVAHAFAFADGAFAFDPLTFLLTGVPAVLAVWLRYRTGSLVLPFLLHNFGNSIIQLA